MTSATRPRSMPPCPDYAASLDDGVDGLRVGVVGGGVRRGRRAGRRGLGARGDRPSRRARRRGRRGHAAARRVRACPPTTSSRRASAHRTWRATTASATACAPTASTPTRIEMMFATRGLGLRPRGEAAHHARHLRAVGRLLRGLLRPGAEGAHARHPRLRGGVRATSTSSCRPPRPRRRSGSARRPTIRWRCT